MMNAMILSFVSLISRFWMATFLVSPHVVFTFLSLFSLQESLVILADFNVCSKTLTAKLIQQG